MRIGSHTLPSPFLLAPMAGVSEMPFRIMALEFGAGLATTELISAKGIYYRNRRTRQYLTYDKEREVPYSVQLFGGDEVSMAAATKAVMEYGADIIDINMGCPVRKVTKTGAGSSLICDPERAASLVRVMRAAVDDKVPITAKIRIGWDDASINCVEMTRALEEAGCAALAVHGRTRAQAYRGQADWTWIAKMKDAAQLMPIIGNGDVESVADAQRMLQQTCCDAVMIGRGALGRPWIFRAMVRGVDEPISATERLRIIRDHFRAHIAFHEDIEMSEEQRRRLRYPPTLLAVRTFRQHLVWYSRGLAAGAAFRKEALQLDDVEQVDNAISRFFGSLEEGAAVDRAEEAEGIDYKQAFG